MKSPAITLMAQSSVSSSSSNFKGFLKYMNRKGAFDIDKEREVQSTFKNYLLYENNPLKTDGAFSLTKDNLTKKEFRKMLKMADLAEQNKCVMFRDVVSFDNKWLEEKGLYNSKTNYLDEATLKKAIRKGVLSMIEEEGMDKSAFMIGAIHRNTDNIHAHIATSELKNSRKNYFNEHTNEFEAKYKRKLRSIKKMKSVIANTLSPNIELRKEITFYNQNMKRLVEETLNNRTIEKGLKLKNLKQEQRLLNKIYNSLPDDLYKYKKKMQSNAIEMENTKKLVNEYINFLIESNPEIQNNYKKFELALSKEEEENKIKYGEKSTSKSNKVDRFKNELGNKVINHMIVLQKQNNSLKRDNTASNDDFKPEKKKISLSSTRKLQNEVINSSRNQENENTKKFHDEIDYDNKEKDIDDVYISHNQHMNF